MLSEEIWLKGSENHGQQLKEKIFLFKAVLGIRMLLGLPDPDPDPDPLVRGMDPDPSIFS